MYLIGPHTSKLESPNAQREAARLNGWGVIQTFASNPRTLSVDPGRVDPSDDGRRDILWVVHSSYPALFVPPERTRTPNAVYMLNLAKWCQKAGATRAVIHLGGTKDREPSDVVNAAKEYWAQQTQLHDFLRQHQIKLLIENVAAAYPTNQDLEYLISITKETPDILGWCLDTAHANAAGVSYDTLRDILSNPEKKPDVVHCNYPGSLFRSGRDVHGWYYKDETPLQDDAKPLWEDIVKTAYRSGCPLVVEGSSSPGDHQKEVLALIALCESNTKANP